MFVMQVISPPARRMRSVTAASPRGTKPWRMAEPHVSGTPAIATESLIAIRLPERIPSQPSARTRQAAHDRVERILLRARAPARLAHGLDGDGQLRLLRLELVEHGEDGFADLKELVGLLAERVEAPAAGGLRELGPIHARGHQSFQNGRRTHPSS